MLRFTQSVLACVAVACSGCCRVPEFITADYGKGVTFSGADGEIYSVTWFRPKGKLERCPLVVRLKDGTQLDESRFSSTKFMCDLGGHTQNRNGNKYDLMVDDKSGASLWSEYEKGELVSVGANLGVGSKHSLKVILGDRTVTLPASESELFESLGKPQAFSKGKPPASY